MHFLLLFHYEIALLNSVVLWNVPIFEKHLESDLTARLSLISFLCFASGFIPQPFILPVLLLLISDGKLVVDFLEELLVQVIEDPG